MSDLNALAERVEAGASIGDVVNELMVGLGVNDARPIIKAIHNHSLDAAQALHDAVLPGWGWATGYDNVNELHFCNVWSGKHENMTEAYAPTPAAAWVAAILRAKAQEESDE